MSAEESYEIALNVNGETRQITAPARRLLSDALRGELGLTGTHVGCEHGVCGCCTVLIEGNPVRSCLTFAVAVQGKEIQTVEGLAAENGDLHPVQEAFRECHGLQCGFCTPGFLMTAAALIEQNHDPSEEEITEAIAGNLCRCTGYQNIRNAVRYAAELMKSDKA
ncbi:MAG: (2Fe-2S)-binding protein [Actinomycetota bacterium]|nr:(2Fe-2S)-binding protein [Actinomycetota bacterium]MEE3257365.1 (2Fe-2S)-binding protein [Actinomycetota bacterium]